MLDIVIVEKCEPPSLQVPALVEVALQERSEERDEVSVIIVKALSKTAPFRVESGGLNEQGVVLRLKLGVKHHPVHDIIQHELQTLSDHYPSASHGVISFEVAHHQVHLLLPHVTVLVDDLVGEKWDRHDSSHFAPVIAVDGEDHVLAIASEDIKHNVSGARTKFNTLGVKDLGGELRIRDNDEVFGAEFEKEDRAVGLGHGSEETVIEVIANLKPIAKDRDRERARRDIGGVPCGVLQE